MYDSTKGIYDMILGRDILTSLGLNIEFSDHIIEAYDGPFKVSTETIVDLGTYEFKEVEMGDITPKELFMNAYTEKVHESEQVHTSTKQLLVILDDKYDKADLN